MRCAINIAEGEKDEVRNVLRQVLSFMIIEMPSDRRCIRKAVVRSQRIKNDHCLKALVIYHSICIFQVVSDTLYTT